MKKHSCSVVVEEDSLGIGGVGGFVDTTGSVKRHKRKDRNGASEGEPAAISSPVNRDVLKDEVEERLEEILFGRKPAVPSTSISLDTDSEEEQEVSKWLRDIG